MTSCTKFVGTLLIVDDLPSCCSAVRGWSMPDAVCLRNLAELLGQGSQAAIFTSYNVGDEHSEDHDLEWQRAFNEMLAEAWPGGNSPAVFVERGYASHYYGDDRNTRSDLFGGEAVPWPGGSSDMPTPLRLYTPSFWRERETEQITADLCHGIILTLVEDGGPLSMDRPVEHYEQSPNRLAEWLQDCRFRSFRYKRLAVVTWEDQAPIVTSTIGLTF